MERYEHTFDGDLALLAWWLHLGETGELEKLFARSSHRLGMFVRHFDAPVELLYDKDEKGWSRAAWLWPLMSGCSFNLWIREDVRQTRGTYHFITDAFTRAFELYPVVLVTTNNPAVLRQACHFGFRPMDSIPYLFDGGEALIGVATANDFMTAMQPSLKETH